MTVTQVTMQLLFCHLGILGSPEKKMTAIGISLQLLRKHGLMGLYRWVTSLFASFMIKYPSNFVSFLTEFNSYSYFKHYKLMKVRISTLLQRIRSDVCSWCSIFGGVLSFICVFRLTGMSNFVHEKVHRERHYFRVQGKKMIAVTLFSGRRSVLGWLREGLRRLQRIHLTVSTAHWGHTVFIH